MCNLRRFLAESTGKENKTENQEGKTKVDNVEKSLLSLVWVYILLAILLMVLIAGVILYLRKGIKFYHAPVSSVTGERNNSDTNEINRSRC